MPPISEPMTMLTDYVLAALGLWWGLRLLRMGASAPAKSIRLWGWAFLAMALGALLGGTSHGFALWLAPGAQAALWKATVFSIGFASYFLVTAMAWAALPERPARIVGWAALVKLAAYLAWMTAHDAFVYVIADYAPSLLAALIAGLYLWRGRRRPEGRWIAGGVGVSFLGAGIQASGFAPHPNFNHNDLYHVVQMLGLWLLFRGASRLRDREKA